MVPLPSAPRVVLGASHGMAVRRPAAPEAPAVAAGARPDGAGVVPALRLEPVRVRPAVRVRGRGEPARGAPVLDLGRGAGDHVRQPARGLAVPRPLGRALLAPE